MSDKDEFVFISREELISDESNWYSTDKLNLDFFDDIHNKFESPYYLKTKNSDEIYCGSYIPEEKSFRAHPMGRSGYNQRLDECKIKREDISSFISLPPLEFKIEERYTQGVPENE